MSSTGTVGTARSLTTRRLTSRRQRLSTFHRHTSSSTESERERHTFVVSALNWLTCFRLLESLIPNKTITRACMPHPREFLG